MIRMVGLVSFLMMVTSLYGEVESSHSFPQGSWNDYRSAFPDLVYRSSETHAVAQSEAKSIKDNAQLMESLESELSGGPLVSGEVVMDLSDSADWDASLYDLYVTGVGQVNGQAKVFFENRATQKSYYLAEGAKEDGIEVSRIARNEVIFKVGAHPIKVDRAF